LATSLRHNLTSAYLDAAHKFSSKKGRRRIVAYVESYDDIAFWRTLLAEFENEERYFQVMLPSATSLAKGKKMVLMNTLNTTELGRSLIACVDSDYDFLLQGATNVSRKINRNPYIFQTYGYAIENFHCFAESLHEVCVQATLNDRHILDFPAFLKRYSQIAYPLFLWNVWFYRRHDTHTFPMYDFNSYVRLRRGTQADIDNAKVCGKGQPLVVESALTNAALKNGTSRLTNMTVTAALKSDGDYTNDDFTAVTSNKVDATLSYASFDAIKAACDWMKGNWIK
jgi:hypothetical protein